MSLIEVLVLMATLSLLVGVLVPAVSGARGRSVGQAELSNLRTLISTAQMYADHDPNNVLGPVHPQHDTFTNEGFAEFGGGPGLSPFTNWGQQFDPRTLPLNRLLYGFDELVQPPPPVETAPGDRSVFKPFQCLGQDQGWQEWPGFGSSPIEEENSYFKTNGTSFRMNNLTFSDGVIAGIYGRPVSLIPTPSLTLAFMEARAFQTLWTNDTWGFSSSHGELTGYHKKLGFFYVAFADGHADFVDMGDGTFFPQTAEHGFRDVRGTWGRMDCSPADNILSD